MLLIKKEVRDKLKELKREDETYDEIIRKLIENFEKNGGELKKYNHNSEFTTIIIRDETKEMLDNIGKKGMSYSDILNSLIEAYGGEDDNER